MFHFDLLFLVHDSSKLFTNKIINAIQCKLQVILIYSGERQWRINGKGGLVDERRGLLCWGGRADGATGLEIGILIRDVTLHVRRWSDRNGVQEDNDVGRYLKIEAFPFCCEIEQLDFV